MKIILGSKSEGRQSVLKNEGIDFEVMVAGIDEKAIRNDDPEKLVILLAKAKANALMLRIKEPALLITSDQVVVCNGDMLEKPINEEEARDFISRYREHPLETVSSVLVTNTETGVSAGGVDIAKVYFSNFPETAIDEVIANGRVMRCAGAMRCEDEPFIRYVIKFEGTEDSTSGLPLKLLRRLIEEVS